MRLRSLSEFHIHSDVVTTPPPSPTPPPIPRPSPCDRFMAAASSSSSSRSPPNKRTDKFRPQYPINPFGPSTSTRTTSPSSTSSGFSEPWLLKSDQISFSAAHRRDVVLVLGSKSGALTPSDPHFHTHCSPPSFQLPRGEALRHCSLPSLSFTPL